MREASAASRLISWYDDHARVLPWRIPPDRSRAGERPDPYHIWLSEVMLQQTTVAAVTPYFLTFTRTWPTVQALAGAADADVMAAWAGLGYYARARNLLKCARQVRDQHGGRFPTSEVELLTLPGIGPYTAAAIAAIASGARTVVVDGNVERVMLRLHNCADPLPGSKPKVRSWADAITPDQRAGDYAQAVMDLGATICTPRAPACGICPWLDDCASRKAGTAASLPRKTPKEAKPQRYGIAYLARRADGALLLETRPEKGLLGGMLGLPGGPWTETTATERPPVLARWWAASVEVRHTFTHFHLVLGVRVADVPMGTIPDVGVFHAAQDVSAENLPTVMGKALRAGLHALEARTEQQNPAPDRPVPSRARPARRTATR
ncbi:MAG: A/G-specific adenine glycosylase [Pseudomonadota bacterium]